jgi:methyl-accepting chemotaxis protein
MSGNIESRVKTVEEAMQTLTHLALRADERMDAQDRRLDEQDRRFDEFDKRMTALAEAQRQTAEAQRQTEANLSALTSIVADTERRLNSLAALVERFISEGRNGKS